MFLVSQGPRYEYEWAPDKSAAILWCRHVSMEQERFQYLVESMVGTKNSVSEGHVAILDVIWEATVFAFVLQNL